MVVVADTRLVAGDRAGRLNPPYQAAARQRSQHVIDRLPRHLGQAGAHGAEKSFGVGMGTGVHRFQHREPRARHAKVSCTELIRVIRRGSHGTNIVPFLESVKSSQRCVADRAKEWDSNPLRPKPRIVFKDVAKARRFVANQELDGAEPRMVVRGNRDDIVRIARSAGVVGTLLDYDPATQQYASSTALA